jgi:hypothetical protein
MKRLKGFDLGYFGEKWFSKSVRLARLILKKNDRFWGCPPDENLKIGNFAHV